MPLEVSTAWSVQREGKDRGAHDAVDPDGSAQKIRVETSCETSADPAADQGERSHEQDCPPLDRTPNHEDHDRNDVDGELEHGLQGVHLLEVIAQSDPEHREEDHAEDAPEVPAVDGGEEDADDRRQVMVVASVFTGLRIEGREAALDHRLEQEQHCSSQHEDGNEGLEHSVGSGEQDHRTDE